MRKAKVKKMTPADLRKLVLQEVKNSRIKPHTKKCRTLAALLFEQDEEKEESSGASITKDTNIADIPVDDVWTQLTSGNADAPLYKAMASANGWAAGAMEGAGGAEALKAWAEGIGEGELKERIGKVVQLIGAADTSKFDMPALEGGDADEVADAISDTSGELGVDFSSEFANGMDDLQKWYDSLPDVAKQKYEAGEIPTLEDVSGSEEVKESHGQLGAFIFEDILPRFGRGPMPGAPSVGEKASVDKNKIKGLALAFLTKGMLDGSPGDHVEVSLDGNMSNGKMKPTQSNILAAKSLLFAFTKPEGVIDMGGAFATADGDILDGHHRWSGTLIATGGDTDHTGVHIVHAPSGEVTKLLTVVGNALGRQQKGPEPENESVSKNSDKVILERWQKLAGLNE